MIDETPCRRSFHERTTWAYIETLQHSSIAGDKTIAYEGVPEVRSRSREQQATRGAFAISLYKDSKMSTKRPEATQVLICIASGGIINGQRGLYISSWITRPERSLGSNHVVLGGMMLPVSAMSISCFIDTG